MNLKLVITCDCGSHDILDLKKTLEVYEGKIYEDYSSITNAKFSNNKLFKVSQSQPDTVYIECLNVTCKKVHELIT
jgi:hypothetical protein